ncbi:hypothetical protein DH09_15060 [Bacillaceae bacterium JMAK1]|nr:hypothetical protein DH09_15060 [Bacillaceae bacterium JMAK1]
MTSKKSKRFTLMFSDLKQKILQGDWEPEARMPTLAILSENYNVSMSTTREVLRALENESLINMYQGRGTFVSKRSERRESTNTDFNADEIVQLLHLSKYRRMIEPAFAESAAIQAYQEEIEQIIASAQRMKQLALHGESTKEEDLKFHFLIANATHNPYVAASYNDLQGKLRDGREFTNVPGMIEKAAHYHSMIAEAIRTRNGGQAKLYMMSHMEANEAHLLAQITQ